VNVPVVLVPLDGMEARLLHPVAADVLEVFGLVAQVAGPAESPASAFDPVRGQYRAAEVLALLRPLFPPRPSTPFGVSTGRPRCSPYCVRFSPRPGGWWG